MTRIKIVPDAEPNADGEWVECPVELPRGTRWRHMETVVAQCVPAGHHVVSVECGSRTGDPVSTGVVPLKKQ